MNEECYKYGTETSREETSYKGHFCKHIFVKNYYGKLVHIFEMRILANEHLILAHEHLILANEHLIFANEHLILAKVHFGIFAFWHICILANDHIKNYT